MTPNIRYYARLSLIAGTKTPKYVITHEAGFCAPMSRLIGADGKISFFLMQKRENQPSNTPPMSLQGKNSFNFTGLKDYYRDGKISGFAFGYPNREPTYRYKGKAVSNPFFEYRNDGYLFIVHQHEKPTPSIIELIILEDAIDMIASYCKMLVMGGFNEPLERARKAAKPYNKG